MEEDIISLKTAKLAKEKGFDIPCAKIHTTFWIPYLSPKYYAPTQPLLQKWLRVEHNIHVYVVPNNTKRPEGNYEVCVYSNNEKLYYHFGFDTYEEALEKGLFEALKLI